MLQNKKLEPQFPPAGVIVQQNGENILALSNSEASTIKHRHSAAQQEVDWSQWRDFDWTLFQKLFINVGALYKGYSLRR